MNKKALQDAYDCYNDEVAQVEEEYENGDISYVEYNMYLDNLAHNLQSEISEIKGASDA